MSAIELFQAWAVGYKARLDWAKGCFKEIWPHRIHGFGFGDPKLVMSLPWDSVDASSWELGPCRFGNWKSFNNAALRIRGSGHNLRSEIEFYLKVERQARSRWGPVFKAAGLDMGQADRLTQHGFGNTNKTLSKLATMRQSVYLVHNPATPVIATLSRSLAPVLSLSTGARDSEAKSLEQRVGPIAGLSA
jgi:hypothetical protein